MTDEPTRPFVPEPVTGSHVPLETLPGTVNFPIETTITHAAPASTTSDAGIPGYEVLGELGRGGMGVVFRARNVRLNREVALKLMLAGGSTDRRELTRFLAEAEAVAAVRHPNVIQIYESGEVGGKPYMILELLPGGTLTERLQSLKGRPPAEAAAIITKVARGVAAVHELGIVHRDLKPGNVLLDEHGEPKVTDFGLAKVASGSDLTRTDAIFGTPAYMAPEQASGNAKFVGPQADVWALGVMLHEALAGQRPFQHSNIGALLALIREEEPQPLRSQNSAIPRDLDVICRKCLEKDPADRYPTARELADDLARFVAGEPITARSAGFAERSVKWAKRKPALAGLYAATVVAVVSLGVGLLLWQSESAAREEKRNAEEARVIAESAKADAEHAATQARAAEASEKVAREKAEAGEKREAMLRESLARLEYARSLDLAHREYSVNDIARARGLLQNCAPAFRGWEWDHVHRLCHADTRTISDCRYLCAVSPDGKRAADWFAGKIRVWDTSTGTTVGVSSQRFQVEPGVAFHPDGTEMVVFEPIGSKVEVWDANTGKVLRTLGVHDEKSLGRPQGAVVYNRTGTLLLTMNQTNATAKVWDATTGKVRFVLPKQGNGLWAGAFSPDDKRILIAHTDGAADVWDMEKEERVLDLKGHTGMLRAAAFTPDGSKLVTSGADGVRVWNAESGAPLKTFATKVGIVFSLAVDRTGTKLLTGSMDRTVQMWEIASGEPIATLRGHTQWVRAVAFTDDGAGVVSGGDGEAGRVWRFPSLPTGIVGLGAWNQSTANAVGITADGTRLVASGHGVVGVWDTRTGAPVPLRLPGVESIATTFVSPDGAHAAAFQGKSKGVLGTIRKLNPVGGVVELETGDFGTYAPQAMSFSPDGKLFAGSDGSRVFVWDTSTGKILARYTGHTRQVHHITLGSTGRVASIGEDFSFRVWEATTGKQLHARSAADRSGRSAFNRDGTRIVTTCLGELLICDTETLTPQLKISGNATALAFDRDGTRLVVGQQVGDVKVFDARTGIELLTLRGHSGFVAVVGFSPDGQRLLTVGADGTARTWETAPLNRAFIKLSDAP